LSQITQLSITIILKLRLYKPNHNQRIQFLVKFRKQLFKKKLLFKRSSPEAYLGINDILLKEISGL